MELKQNGTNENKSEQQKVHVKHRNEALTKAPSYSREEMLQMRKSMISMEEEGRGMNSPAIVALRQSDPVVVRHLLPQSAPKVT